MPSRTLKSRLLWVSYFALLLNSAYIKSFADPTLWYFLQIALHPLLGLGLAGVLIVPLLRRRWTLGGMGLTTIVVSAIGLLLGVVILVLGATTPHRMLVNAHVATSGAGAALLFAYLWIAAPRLNGLGGAWAAAGVDTSRPAKTIPPSI